MVLKETLKEYKWLIFIIAIFLISAILVGLAYYYFTKAYNERIYPGVYLGNLHLGGLTKEEAEKILDERINIIEQNGIIINYLDHKIVLSPLFASTEEKLNFQIVSFDTKKTVDEAFKIGRGLNFFVNLTDRIRTTKKPMNISASMNYDKEKIKENLSSEFFTFEQPAQDAKLVHKIGKDENYNFDLEKEKSGLVADYEKGIEEILANLSKLKNTPVTINNIRQEPKVYQKDCSNINEKANNFLMKAPFELSYEKENKKIDKNIFVDWLALGLSGKAEDKVEIILDENAVKKFLNDEIAKNFNKKPEDSKFTIKDGRVIEFQTSKDGIEIDINESYKEIEKNVEASNKEITLVVNTIKSAIANENINNLGIKEKLGTGKSDFSGSPNNRRHNIKTGANALNGMLIKSNEEFSTIKALGNIDASTGYLTELVIKENKTIPEYGGGLCQIGTTMFRAALSSGLPITMRRNHSYRVQYYEPAGTDATIYDPLPDLRFMNDTADYVLIQSRIEGNILYFDLWGTSDGRNASTTYPKIYNIVKPQPTKIIETTDLKPGEKKCTEKAHNGADAYFDYHVLYPNGEKKDERFSSHYVPWREVCLLGVEKKSEDSLSTSTPANGLDTDN